MDKRGLKAPMTFEGMDFKPLPDPMEFDNDDPQKAPLVEEKPGERKPKIPQFKAFSIPLSSPFISQEPDVKRWTQASPVIKCEQIETQRKTPRATPYHVARSLIEQGVVVSASKLLYFFDGKSFQPCRKEEAEKRIVESCRDAVAAEGRPSFARQVYQSLLQEPEICRDEQLHLNVVALDDCLLNLDSFQTQPHTHDLFVTTRLCASYLLGRRTSCPTFQQFLEVVSGDDAVLQRRIWQMIGYLLVPDQTGKSFFLLQGVPNSGKTVLGNLIRSCFGGDVVSALDINELGGEFALSDLVGKKLCVDFDLPADPFSKRAVSKLKKLTGGDPTSSNVKFADRVKFVNTAKLLFATNHAALIPNQDEAFFDRMAVIPFKVSIPREAQDRQLSQKLEQERDAIIVRALDAYRELRNNGYIFAGYYLPNEAVAGESNPVDAIAHFFTSDCELLGGGWEPTERLYRAFVSRYGPLCGKNSFSTLALHLCEAKYPNVERSRARITSSSNPTWGFKNIKLREEIL